MKPILPKTLVLSALALAAAAALGTAKIERLTLGQMVDRADNAVIGVITRSEAFRVDTPDNGPKLYYTTLTIDGQSLYTGNRILVDVVIMGGFVSDTEGVHNSEAPSADDVKVGNTIVAFYGWVDDMGGGTGANMLYAAHGGLYRVVSSRRGPVVLGRGEGYAVGANVLLADLEQGVQRLIDTPNRK